MSQKQDMIITKNKTVKETRQKDFAENFVHEKGYVREVKPRSMNNVKGRVEDNYAIDNKTRLNNSLAKTPRGATMSLQAKKTKKVTVGEMEKRSEIAKTPFPVPYIVCIVLLTVMFLYVIHLYIEIDDMNAELTDFNNKIVDMKSEETDLEIKKNNMYDLEEIERIAREEYGMVNKDQLPKEYITPDSEDDIEIIEAKSEEVAPGELLSVFAKSISNLLSYIN